jgi:hypothetical protein
MNMADWIEKEAQRIKDREVAEAKEREWQIHKRELIKEQWESAWRAVRDAAKRQVEVFNSKFPDQRDKQIMLSDEADSRFTVQREYNHVVKVIQVSADVSAIHLRRIETNRGTGGGPHVSHDDIRYGATTDGDVGVASNGGILLPDKAAENILGFLF